MHAKLVNLARLRFTLTPRSPVLIRAGGEGLDPSLPEVSFVRTRAGSAAGEEPGGSTVFLPGTTLKGLFRAHGERILRSLGVRCCDPLAEREACRRGDLRGFKVSGEHAYRKVCYACKVFGSPSLAGRTMLSDALPVDADARWVANHTECRTSIAVDRLLGSVAAGPFEVEAVVGGAFAGDLILRNIPLWSLALCALVLRDLDDDLLQIGFGKSRGFGFVGAHVDELEYSLYGSRGGGETLPGLLALSGGELASDGENGPALRSADRVPLPEGTEHREEWCRHTYRWTDEAAWSLLGACVEGPFAALAAHGARGGQGGRNA
jgi:CRISPR/Cas system CSM-associated protein Csm3 (group 7 of RAMP superfamily)